MFTCNTIQGLAPVHTLHFNKAEQRRGEKLWVPCPQHHSSFCTVWTASSHTWGHTVAPLSLLTQEALGWNF